MTRITSLGGHCYDMTTRLTTFVSSLATLKRIIRSLSLRTLVCWITFLFTIDADSIAVKNITYRLHLRPFSFETYASSDVIDLAKTSPHVVHPERFALHLGTYLVSKYAHIHKAFVTIEQLKWKRIDVNGQEHKHSFWRDGDEKRVVHVEVSCISPLLRVIADFLHQDRCCQG